MQNIQEYVPGRKELLEVVRRYPTAQVHIDVPAAEYDTIVEQTNEAKQEKTEENAEKVQLSN